jgi:hypothetical protein
MESLYLGKKGEKRKENKKSVPRLKERVPRLWTWGEPFFPGTLKLAVHSGASSAPPTVDHLTFTVVVGNTSNFPA